MTIEDQLLDLADLIMHDIDFGNSIGRNSEIVRRHLRNLAEKVQCKTQTTERERCAVVVGKGGETPAMLQEIMYPGNKHSLLQAVCIECGLVYYPAIYHHCCKSKVKPPLPADTYPDKPPFLPVRTPATLDVIHEDLGHIAQTLIDIRGILDFIRLKE